MNFSNLTTLLENKMIKSKNKFLDWFLNEMNLKIIMLNWNSVFYSFNIYSLNYWFQENYLIKKSFIQIKNIIGIQNKYFWCCSI